MLIRYILIAVLLSVSTASEVIHKRCPSPPDTMVATRVLADFDKLLGPWLVAVSDRNLTAKVGCLAEFRQKDDENRALVHTYNTFYTEDKPEKYHIKEGSDLDFSFEGNRTVGFVKSNK